jgi:hypothetical protein
MKPLYLHGHQPITVALDGPALRVSSAESADRLFPLQRLTRVVVSGEVTWSTEALLACADQDVPITFLHRTGGLRARLLGRPRGRPVAELHDALETALDAADGATRVRDWLSAQAANRRRDLARRLFGGPVTSDAGALREHLRAQARRYAPEDGLKLLDARLAALVHAQVAQLLARAGLASDDPLLAVHGIELARGLAEVVGWDLQVPKIRFLWRRKRVAERAGDDYPVVTVRAVTHFFEGEAERIEAAVGQLVIRLYRFLLEGLDGDAD